jgi:hypothetical protein
MTNEREKATIAAETGPEAGASRTPDTVPPGPGASGPRREDHAGQPDRAGEQTAAGSKTEVTPEERSLWDIDFGVKKSLRYHARRRAFFERLDNLVNVLVAVTGASAFAVLMGEHGSLFSKIATGIVALLSLAAVVLGFGRCARAHQDLYRKFSDLAIEIAEIERPSGRDIARLRAKRLALEAEEPHIIDALERHCWNEEAEARGTPRSELQPLNWFQRMRLHFT